VAETSEVAVALLNDLSTHTEYYKLISDIGGVNNGIYNLIYQPNTDASCLIKV